MTTFYPNATVPWRNLLVWLDAQDGAGTLQRAIGMWGPQLVISACEAGDVSAPKAEAGQWSMLQLTDQGRAKL